MNEKTFVERLAAEVEKHDDARIKLLIEWCQKTAQMLQQCHGIAEVQRVHARATTGIIFSDLVHIEATGDMPSVATCDTSPFTEEDSLYVTYSYVRDSEKRTFTIHPTVMEIVPGQITTKVEGKRSTTWKIEPLVLEMSPNAVIPEPTIALS